MTFLRSLCPKRFYEVPHGGIICVFHELVKRFTVPQIELKQNALLDLRGIVNTLFALEDNGLENNHPFSVPIPSIDPVKFYRKKSHKYLPGFPGRCVIAVGWQTNKFFSPRLPLTVFCYSSIQMFSWILVHPILVDAIYHVVGAEKTDV